MQWALRHIVQKSTLIFKTSTSIPMSLCFTPWRQATQHNNNKYNVVIVFIIIVWGSLQQVKC